MSRGLKISDGMTASDLRAWARGCGSGRAAARAYAIANALDGLDRAEAARLAKLLERRPVNVAVVALANKTARIVWAVLTRGETYRRPTATPAEA